MVPKIEFRYSWIYDQFCKSEAKTKNYPTSAKIEKYMRTVEPLWRKEEKKILTEMSRVTGITWEEKNIICYFVGEHIPFSDPLTIPATRKKERFVDILTHEMIHILFRQNKANDKVIAWISKTYPEEADRTKLHVPIHAIHKHILLKFFGQKRLDAEIKSLKHLKDYRRSWEIVQEEGYENIIKRFRQEIQ